MSFIAVRYDYVPELLKKHAESMGRKDVVSVIDKGIQDREDATLFTNFIPEFLDYTRDNKIEIEIQDISYEAETFVDQAGYLNVWEKMINEL